MRPIIPTSMDPMASAALVPLTVPEVEVDGRGRGMTYGASCI
jgi:hypothetical protein